MNTLTYITYKKSSPIDTPYTYMHICIYLILRCRAEKKFFPKQRLKFREPQKSFSSFIYN